jgi:hypothetical protein
VPLRIAFDLDGVLADMDGALVQQAEQLFGEAVTRQLLSGPPAAPAPDAAGDKDSASDQPTAPGPEADAAATDSPNAPVIARLRMSPRETRRLWRHVQTVENFWESLAETEPGVIGRLHALATARRWEVIFLTKRPASAGATSQLQTQRWLQDRGFALPSVYVVQGSRGKIAAALDLDFVVDDRPENCLDIVVDSQARAILVWRDTEKQLPTAAQRLGIGVVRSVDQCLEILTQVDAPPASKPGLLDRVMELLGLKEPARAPSTDAAVMAALEPVPAPPPQSRR